ncbi:MAG: amidohydrolase family protein, partial [Rhodothermales bacterium]|nr:amidohydrolase family protein [Rhodothermales bacterium]
LVDLVGADTPVHIHVSEQPAEVAEIRKNLGDTPIAWLNREFGLSPRWALVHATQATPAELDLIDDGAATLVLCPTTEHDLGDGRFPIERTPGASWGVGSDSQVSVSPAEELRLMLYGQRAAQGKRAVLPSTEHSDGSNLWQRTTQGASAVTGSPVGRIAPGHAADFVVLDGARPDFTGLTADHVLSAWVLSGQAHQIAEVRVGGAVVAQHGAHVDHSELAEGARAALSVLRS